MKQPNFIAAYSLLSLVIVHGTAAAAIPAPEAVAEAARIYEATGVMGGMVVHVGCGDGKLTSALVGDRYGVHGLDTDPANVTRARAAIREVGPYGRASIDRYDGNRLPYVDNLINLVVAEQLGPLGMDEVLRVLAPKGVAYIKVDGSWQKTVKPRPADIDEWTHYLHDASNNAVAHDRVVGPPRRLQWVGGPRYARHHDKMSSMSALVSAGGRVFYVFDEAPRVSILLPPQWRLIARDAFNGTILWKRSIDKWHSHLWPLKSGPAQLPRRLVAAGDRVYVTLGIDSPLEALDAATGETVHTYEGTEGTEEIILSDGVLFVVSRDAGAAELARSSRNRGTWGPQGWKVTALQADTGQTLWSRSEPVLPNTLAVDDRHVVWHSGEKMVCLDRRTGQDLWRSEPIARSAEIRSFYAPTLLIYRGVVLFSGGETAGKQTGSWYRTGKDTMAALDAENGKLLWSAAHPPSGYRSAEDLLVVDDLVWTGETTSGRAEGVFTGRDLRTGEVKRRFEPDVSTYWFHHRCYRGKATDNYLLMSRTGIEFVDIQKESWSTNHFVRGACLYGIMPANGLVYAPQHPCACYLEAKLYGFSALAPAGAAPRVVEIDNVERLVRGPAFDQIARRETNIADNEDWPTYRHDNRRSGHASTAVPTSLKAAWNTSLGGRLSSPVIADNILLVASIDTHTVHAIDAVSGNRLWDYTAGGRVDSPPTYYRGRVFFGSADGWVYCLRASDGALAWRFLAAPMDQRTLAFEQLESVWPVHGSVLIKDGVLFCVAGRSMFLDGGLRLWRLEPATGEVISETLLNDKEEATGKDLHEFVSWLNMPTGLPDVLSADEEFVYMRSQPFELNGKRLPLKTMPRGGNADSGAPEAIQGTRHAHLFSPSGFLDDTWWHRSYWMYGTMFVSGWQGYYRAGTKAPAGRILALDDATVYGFGRKPQYWKWTTPLEHHLFAAPKKSTSKVALPKDASAAEQRGTRVRIAKSPSLNMAGTPVTVGAWVNAQKDDGVILASGGNVHGFALYLKGGRPTFAVRVNQKLVSVTAKEAVPGRWVHLAGVLTKRAELQIYVDGQLSATGKAPGLIPVEPRDAMEIGVDDASLVGDYGEGFGFSGLIDELRMYRRSLTTAEIVAVSKDAARTNSTSNALALSYSFDDGRAADGSGNKNHGTIEGATSAEGRVGRALKFVGPASGSRRGPPVPGFQVEYRWTIDLPLFARGMVVADGMIFVAGPDDLIDEEGAFRRLNDPETQEAIARQVAAWSGKDGAVLWAVSTDTGKKLTELRLDTVPVFDGMAAADGRLYVCGADGSVLCLGAD